MIAYDPTVIQQFAERLYTRARSIVVGYGVFGLVIGLWVSWMFASRITGRDPNAGTVTDVVSWLGAGIGAMLGISIGREKSFSLRLQAQTLLLQAQIEMNTAALRPDARRAGGQR